MCRLGDYFRARRLERQISLGQLARQVGYKNLSRGSNRIHRFESGGCIAPDLLQKLAEALGIGPDEVRRLAAEDFRQWLRWAEEPIRPYLVLRWMAAVYQRLELPDEALDPEAAETFAAGLARERRLQVCLVLSRRITVYFDARGVAYQRQVGTPAGPNIPYMEIGGKRIHFDFVGGVPLRPIDELGP